MPSMTVQHLTILAVVEVRPGAAVEFGCEVEQQVSGLYRSRGAKPTWGRAVPSVQDAVCDEALRVYAALLDPGEAKVDIQETPNPTSDTRH